MNPRKRSFQLLLLAMISLCAAGAFAAAPTISGFSPASGILSSTVTITGANFVAPMTVSFGGVASTLVSVSSSTVVHATVPLTAATGTITLQDAGGSVTSTSAYTVLPGVGAATTTGPPTIALTLYYSGLGDYETVDLYFDTEDFGIGVTSVSGAGNLPVTVPADARPGTHWITASGRHSGYSAQISFTVRTSWPQFGFTPSHKAKNHYENVLSTATVANLDEAWRTPSIGEVHSTPAVVNGIAYVGFINGSFRAFNETTGAPVWTFAAGSAIYSSPAISNGILYFGSDDHNLYALDAVTGALKWRYQTGSYVESSPNVVNGIVYFGSEDNNVYALNATTGVLIWKYATGGYVYSSPMVANGVLYVGSADYSVYALNAATGAKIWSYATGSDVLASPVITGGFVCVGSYDGSMYALRALTGEYAWSFSVGSPPLIIQGSAAAVGGAIFFGDGNGSVYSLTSGGAFRWSTQLPGEEQIDSGVCVADGVVYVTTESYTYALDQNSGAVLTTLPVGSIEGGAAVVNGAVFAGDIIDRVLARYTLNALLSNYVAPRPDPMQLRPQRLR